MSNSRKTEKFILKDPNVRQTQLHEVDSRDIALIINDGDKKRHA